MPTKNLNFSILTVVLVTICIACDKFEPGPNVLKQRLMRDVGIDEIPEIESLLSESLALYNNKEENRFQLNDGGSTLNLEIDWSKIVELIDTLGNINYSIAIRDEENAPYTFHNLVVGKTPEGGIKKPFLMTYTMSSEFRDIYDQTLSIQGFTGIAKKRFIDLNSNDEGNSSAPFSLGSTSSNDPCPRETQVTNNTTSSGGGGNPDQKPPAPDDNNQYWYFTCYSYFIDFDDSESCGGGCVTASRSIIVTECYGTSFSSSDGGNCYEGEEIAVIDPNNCLDFDDVVDKVLNTEGGFKNDIEDDNDPTNRGISWPTWQRYANSVLGKSPTLSNLQNLSAEDAKAIYKMVYWNKINLDLIADGDLRYLLFDSYVHSGSIAIKQLQLALENLGKDIEVDGIMGLETIAAINSSDAILLYNSFKNIRKTFYENLTDPNHSNYKEGYEKYRNGFLNRINKFLDKTLENNFNVNCI